MSCRTAAFPLHCRQPDAVPQKANQPSWSNDPPSPAQGKQGPHGRKHASSRSELGIDLVVCREPTPRRHYGGQCVHNGIREERLGNPANLKHHVPAFAELLSSALGVISGSAINERLLRLARVLAKRPQRGNSSASKTMTAEMIFMSLGWNQGAMRAN